MIRIVICDDNKVFMESLCSEIRKVLAKNEIQCVVHTFDDAAQIPEHILSRGAIYFLDIDFEGKKYNGIDIARKIRKKQQSSVLVFVTNYIEFAPEGYEVQAFRYLLKQNISKKLEQCLIQAIEKLRSEEETIQINISGEILSIPLPDILYIESQGHLAVIHISKRKGQTTKRYSFYSSLTSLEEQLSAKGFLRIQKSYLVNMRRIKRFQCSEAVLDNGTVLNVSEKNYAKNKQQYLLWKGRQ